MPIDVNRIRNDIEQIACFTQTPGQGATRPTFSSQWLKARDYIIDQARHAGCSLRIDSIGNVFIRPEKLDTRARTWLCGSHLDTVPNGGDYDGVAGVVSALEILRSARDENRVVPMELVIFAEEEGPTFGLGMIGSRALIGELSVFQLAKLFNAQGQNYLDVGQPFGVIPEKIESDRLDVSKYFGFIELHIEQGPGMWRSGQRVTVVDSISGRNQFLVSIIGEANNAGATNMKDRRDALAGACEVVTSLESFIGENADQAVVTVGRLDVFPNAINVIPQRVDFTVDFRAPDDEQLKEGSHRIEQIIHDIAAKRSLGVEIVRTESIHACPMDRRIVEALRAHAPSHLQLGNQNKMDCTTRARTSSTSGSSISPVISGALHDSAVLAKVLPTALVFIPSRDGISHNPTEFSRVEDIAEASSLIEKLFRRTTLGELNAMDEAGFVHICGLFFEHSPWIASRSWMKRPFTGLDELHHVMLEVVNQSSPDEKLALIRAHPDLVGRLAREGRLTSESTQEQKSAGLDSLSSDEIEQFEHFNGAYREKFGFPFVICARENRKDAILASFPVRLENDRDTEIKTALREIGKIAHLRLKDALWE